VDGVLPPTCAYAVIRKSSRIVAMESPLGDWLSATWDLKELNLKRVFYREFESTALSECMPPSIRLVPEHRLLYFEFMYVQLSG
jgi:hypothetical protein